MHPIKAPRTESIPHAGARSVLLVEDETPLRTIIARNLARRGYNLTAVASVHDAIGGLTAAPPDVVILDISLPDGTGWEILRWLRCDRDRNAPYGPL